MARNQEKAMLLLNRYWSAKKDEGKIRERRPYLASECDSLEKAEKFRFNIIGEISRKVTQIQNPGLGEFRIRDLNDEINKLIREKRHWEERILELGGPDYNRHGPKMIDHEGKEVPGNRGYKYFGAARDLPGVRELFEKKPAKPARLTRGDLARRVNADYYGYRDEDDGVIVALEEEEEKKAIQKVKSQWESQEKVQAIIEDEIDIYAQSETIVPSDEEGIDVEWEEGDENDSVPSQQEIEEMLVRRRKKELLEKYTSEMLVQQSETSKALLGLT
ncbi:PREDICTED: pre-mRNA-splicing factor ISY1 homolog [Amphimedon queenslandica]|uniref:Pre-mRNA-splicing factor ISY1 homolog n=1 Tax=Amphimedon queenslandica TaxID=400682 RepID=A0A1X7UGF0_AMPQE|nr:PREDICTED: pre-mRNA-splicing factor ISY1 homolog [Amphimedon queenslandica]|eukprot:XP_003388122.1 PREDICTED: pre-mRNA-splicing factor ISY1 homolog [Amphimedon queenslandica]